jgi:regulatory protein
MLPPDAMQSRLRQQMLGLLSQREYSRAELQRKFSGKVDDEVLSAVLMDLQAGGLQSDERFVECFIRARKRRGQGPLKISFDLKRHGIDRGLVDDWIDPDDESWLKLAQETRCRRFGEAAPSDLRDASRQARFLAGKGYTPRQISQVIHMLETTID